MPWPSTRSTVADAFSIIFFSDIELFSTSAAFQLFLQTLVNHFGGA
jgi:hypothetical protein